jgi:hypothetical protein
MFRRFSFFLLFSLFSLLFSLVSFSLSAADLYVSEKTGASGRSANGSKEQPFKDLQAALDRANAGDTIRVAEGNYLGTNDRGYLIMDAAKPVNIIGGYSTDFASRDVLRYRTMIQPTAAANDTMRNYALLNIGDITKNVPIDTKNGITIDGLIFDKGFSNAYSPDKGKPAGVDTGMYINPPGQGVNGTQQRVASVNMAHIQWNTGARGNLTIQNCVFANGYYAIRGTWVNGNIKINNCVFVANLMAAVEIPGQTGDTANSYKTKIDFTNNTVLFTWSRTNELSDMGYGFRYMTGASADVDRCIIGMSTLGGLDRTRPEARASDETRRQTNVTNTAFVLNRKGDLTMAVGGTYQNIWVKQFDDVDEKILPKIDGNVSLGGDLLKGKINQAYLEGFLSMNFSESVDLDRNSPANQFRSAFGMNLQATATTKVDMFGNRYPLEDAIKLFGAVQGRGAQAIKN